ncbi:hypothetical protein CCAND95_170019 [Capnocytophaga canis]|nr:hypothetical protein CCAND95_170019 [Capnocytophaga canis]
MCYDPKTTTKHCRNGGNPQQNRRFHPESGGISKTMAGITSRSTKT